MEYSFTIPGRPQVKERPKFRKSGHSYTPKNTAAAEKLIKATYDGPVFTGPIAISIGLTSDETVVHIIDAEWDSPLRGDIDNYVKLVLDGLQGVAFENDQRVVRVEVEKG